MRFTLFFLFFSLSSLSYAQKPGFAAPPAWAAHGSANIDYAPANGKLARDAKDGYVNLVHEVQVNVGTRTTYRRTVIQILTSAGIENRSQVSVSYDPAYQHLLFHKINIIRAGQVISKLDLSRIKTLHQERELARNLYNGTVNSVLILDDVRKGDIIEYAYSIQGFNPIFNNKFCDEEQLQYGAPVGQLLYRVICPANRPLTTQPLQSDLKPLVSMAGNDMIYLWVQNNLPTLKVQDDLPSWYNPYPGVEVSEFQGWGEVNKWALSLFVREHELSAGLKNKIAEIQAASNGDKEKETASALRFVQDEVRYMGIEMGVNSYKPNDPSRIFAQRFGDCKDKSFLLCTMLKAMDIDAAPVLINTDEKQELKKKLPSAVVFDHCTVRVRLGGKTYWFDPTISSQRGGIRDIAYPDYKCGLVLTDTTTGLTDIPLQEPGRVIAKERFILKDNYGPARMEVITTYTGSFADEMRDEMDNNSLSDMQDSFLDFYDNYYQGIKVADSLQVEDDESTGRITMREFYVIDDIWDQKDGKRKAYFEPLLVAGLLRKPDERERTMPFKMTYPARYTEELEIQTPEDWNFSNNPRDVKTAAFNYNFSVSSTQRTVNLKYEYEALKDNVSSDEMPNFLEGYDHVKEDLGYVLTNNVKDRATPDSIGKGGGVSELPNQMKLWVCCILLGVIVYFVRRR